MTQKNDLENFEFYQKGRIKKVGGYNYGLDEKLVSKNICIQKSSTLENDNRKDNLKGSQKPEISHLFQPKHCKI